MMGPFVYDGGREPTLNTKIDGFGFGFGNRIYLTQYSNNDRFMRPRKGDKKSQHTVLMGLLQDFKCIVQYTFESDRHDRGK